MLASSSDDDTAALLDLKTGKKIYSAKTSDGSKFSWLTKKEIPILLLVTATSVCFIWERIKLKNHERDPKRPLRE